MTGNVGASVFSLGEGLFGFLEFVQIPKHCIKNEYKHSDWESNLFKKYVVDRHYYHGSATGMPIRPAANLPYAGLRQAGGLQLRVFSSLRVLW